MTPTIIRLGTPRACACPSIPSRHNRLRLHTTTNVPSAPQSRKPLSTRCPSGNGHVVAGTAGLAASQMVAWPSTTAAKRRPEGAQRGAWCTAPCSTQRATSRSLPSARSRCNTRRISKRAGSGGSGRSVHSTSAAVGDGYGSCSGLPRLGSPATGADFDGTLPAGTAPRPIGRPTSPRNTPAACAAPARRSATQRIGVPAPSRQAPSRQAGEAARRAPRPARGHATAMVGTSNVPTMRPAALTTPPPLPPGLTPRRAYRHTATA